MSEEGSGPCGEAACFSHCSVAALKHHDQRRLLEESIYFGVRFRKDSPYVLEETRQQEAAGAGS